MNVFKQHFCNKQNGTQKQKTDASYFQMNVFKQHFCNKQNGTQKQKTDASYFQMNVFKQHFCNKQNGTQKQKTDASLVINIRINCECLKTDIAIYLFQNSWYNSVWE